MNREDVLKEMKACIGIQDPIVFFNKMTDLFDCLFKQIDHLQSDLNKVKTQSALAIEWEPRIASEMLSRQINILRQDKGKDLYLEEISALRLAFAEDLVTQNYSDFCRFWMDTLGWHPFLEYHR